MKSVGTASFVGTPFEVHCPRCRVTFPIETRKCIHCGGATAPSARTGMAADPAELFRVREAAGAEPIEPESGSPFSISTGEMDEGELAEGPASGSPLRTIFRSLGGLVWIIVLIAFSLARNCGE